jgi:hypothetical protein
MSDSPEFLVRKFFAAWANPKPDELGSFFSDTAVWVDGPQGVRRGADAIKTELAAQLAAVGGVVVELTALVSSGRIFMAEQVHRPPSAAPPSRRWSWQCSNSMQTGESSTGARPTT